MKLNAYLIGNTFAIKEAIKVAGWSWDRDRKLWSRTVECDHDQALSLFSGTASSVKSVRGNMVGCALAIVNPAKDAGKIVWRSKTCPPVSMANVSAGFHAGDLNQDAHDFI